MRTVSQQQYNNPHNKQKEYDKYSVPIQRTNSLAVNAQNLLAYNKFHGNQDNQNPYNLGNQSQFQNGQVTLGNMPLTSSHIMNNNSQVPRQSALKYQGSSIAQSAENISIKDKYPPVYQNVRGSQQNVKLPASSVSFGNQHVGGPLVTKNVYVYDEEDDGDQDENNFLNHIQKVQDLMGKSVQQMKFEIHQERKQKELERKAHSKKKHSMQFQCVSGNDDHHHGRYTNRRGSGGGSNQGYQSKGSQSRNTGSRTSTNGRQYGKKVNNRDISFRIDYFHKLDASFSQVRIVYGMYKKTEKPNPEHTTKYFDIHPHLRIYIKQQYQHMVPSSDLYMYVEIQAYQKSMSELLKYWSIIPVYNDMLYLNQGLWKLHFYDQKYTPQMLLEDGIKPSISTNLLVKICMTRSDIDNDITQAHTEYYMPYLHDHEKRFQEKQMKLEEEQRKQLELERLKQEKKQQNKLERADLRVQNSNDIISQIEDELKELQSSDLPYIKNKQYRKTKYNDGDDDYYNDADESYIDPVNGSVINKSSYYSQFQNQDKTQYQPKRLRPKNWPPQKVTREDIKDFQVEQQTIRLKPMYLYQMSGLHYNFDPRRSVAFTYQTKYQQTQDKYKTKYTDQPVNFGQPLNFRKFEDKDKDEDTLNYINSRNYPMKSSIFMENQSKQTGGFPTQHDKEQEQKKKSLYSMDFKPPKTDDEDDQPQQQQQQQQQVQQQNSIQRSESKKPTQQSQASRISSQPAPPAQEEQTKEETPAEKLEKIGGKIKIQIKTIQLKNYSKDDALGADKMVVGPGGPINDVNGEECQAQAEDLTEKGETGDMYFDEQYQEFLIDVDQFKRMHQNIKELYLILQFMGENDDGDEFCHGWTFIRIVDQNIGELKNGVFENPIYKEPVVPNSPYEESSYTKMDELVTFDIRCTQV